MTRALPPRRDYPDVPYFVEEDEDTLEIRVLRAAWHLLFERELTEISMAELANESCVSTTPVYRRFPSLAHVGAGLAARVMVTLVYEIATHAKIPRTAAGQRALALGGVRGYLRFARRRPRHFALCCSSQFLNPARFPTVRAATDQLFEYMRAFTSLGLFRAATSEEARGFHAIVHGSAALVASGWPVDDAAVVAQVDRYLDGLQQTAEPTRSSATHFDLRAVQSSTASDNTAAPGGVAGDEVAAPEPAG